MKVFFVCLKGFKYCFFISLFIFFLDNWDKFELNDKYKTSYHILENLLSELKNVR